MPQNYFVIETFANYGIRKTDQHQNHMVHDACHDHMTALSECNFSTLKVIYIIVVLNLIKFSDV